MWLKTFFVPKRFIARMREDLMIRKTSDGYVVVSEKGKKLGGPYKSKAKAQKRLSQVEYFKRKKK
jgi:hypothetical protein